MSEDTKYLWVMNNDLAHDVLRLKAEVRSLKAENARLREVVEDWYPHMLKRVGPTALAQWGHIKTMVELGVDIYPLNKPEPRESED